MQILLCAATETEIVPALKWLRERDSHAVSVLITGVGLLAAAYALTREVATSRPSFILQAGVAGSLLSNEQLAQVVTIRSECIGDLGVKGNDSFRSLFDLGLANANGSPWKNGRLQNENALLDNLNLLVVDGVTVNEITTSPEMIAHYRNELNVQAESMEGAALHYVALQEDIPFLQIRSLSNFIGERDKGKWKMKEAIEALNEEIQRIITKLETK